MACRRWQPGVLASWGRLRQGRRDSPVASRKRLGGLRLGDPLCVSTSLQQPGSGLKLARRRWWPVAGGTDVLAAQRHLRGATCGRSWPVLVKES